MGPLADAQMCPEQGCKEPHFHNVLHEDKVPSVAHKQFWQVLLAPQIQAWWSSAEGGQRMMYGIREIENNMAAVCETGTPLSYFDIFCGKDILEHYCKCPTPDYNIHQYDTMLSFSMDGSQLYHNKKSNVLIANWVLLNLDPKSCYKKTEAMPAFTVPGPEKVKHPDLFMFEIHILMDHRLKIQNSTQPVPNQLQTSQLHLLLTLAHAVAIAQMLGTMDHIDDWSCWENCPTKGHLKPTGLTYYPCLHKPDVYAWPKGHRPSSDPADV
jgi:hypothetical protein